MALLTIITYKSYIKKLCMRWWTLQIIQLCSTRFFIAKLMDCFRQHINFYYHIVSKKNIICNYKQLSLTFPFNIWVFIYCGCKFWNGSQMDFFHWSLELVFIFDKITYASFEMAERKGKREEMTSLTKTSSGKSFKFSWPKLFILDKKISLPKSLSNKRFL